MPLYMDRHDIEGVTAQAVAEAHEKDLKVQHKHGTKYLNYWHDQSRGCVFCLVEAPSKEAAVRVHREAHGLLANEIIEVDPTTVKAFLGDIGERPPLMSIAPLQSGETPEDTAFRAILFTDLEGSTTLTSELGDDKALELQCRWPPGSAPAHNLSRLSLQASCKSSVLAKDCRSGIKARET
jgi:hypothetical protein